MRIIKRVFGKTGRRILVASIPSSLYTLIFYFELNNIAVLNGPALPGALIIIFVAYLGIDYLNRNRWDISILDKLRVINNSTSRDHAQLTTVRQFLIDSKEEEKLQNGDEVHILTNALRLYDNAPAAVDVIARNVKEAVKYIYYVNLRDYASFEKEKDAFVNLLQRHSSDPRHTVIESNLDFYQIEESCFYNFAVVKSVEGSYGYWYTTIPSSAGPNENHLVITELNVDNTSELMRVFDDLRKHGTELKAF